MFEDLYSQTYCVFFGWTGLVRLVMQCLFHLPIHHTSCPVSAQVECYHHILTYRVLESLIPHQLQRVRCRTLHLPRRLPTQSSSGKCPAVSIRCLAVSVNELRIEWIIVIICIYECLDGFTAHLQTEVEPTVLRMRYLHTCVSRHLVFKSSFQYFGLQFEKVLGLKFHLQAFSYI